MCATSLPSRSRAEQRAREPQRAVPSDSATLAMHQDMLSRALRLYWERLKASIRARRYLKERGITASTVKRFGLGYAENAKQGLKAAFPNYQVPALVDAGLTIDGKQGRYDRFRDRIMFPILDDAGRIIGFGGRIIDGDAPKYLNSPETPLFDKGATLYGLAQARNAIQTFAEVFVVEGYMDVVMTSQHGVENIVATLGTSTTEKHVRKLMSLPVRRIVFCFDGDAAGRKAAERALESTLDAVNTTTTELAFMFLPNTEDPDSFVRKHGAEAFRGLAAMATPLEEFFLERVKVDCDLASMEGRSRLAHNALELLRRIKDAGLYYRLCERVARMAQLSVAEVIGFSGEGAERTWFAPAQPTTPSTAVGAESTTNQTCVA